MAEIHHQTPPLHPLLPLPLSHSLPSAETNHPPPSPLLPPHTLRQYRHTQLSLLPAYSHRTTTPPIRSIPPPLAHSPYHIKSYTASPYPNPAGRPWVISWWTLNSPHLGKSASVAAFVTTQLTTDIFRSCTFVRSTALASNWGWYHSVLVIFKNTFSTATQRMMQRRKGRSPGGDIR